MEEIQNESNAPAEPVRARKAQKLTWKQWFATDDAVRWVYLIFGLLATFLIMILLQFSTSAICCGDWDGYYHIRWSALLWESLSSGNWLPEFKWLPLTVLSPQDYADHHFLFHLLQIPFLWFFEPVMAAKVAAVFYGSLAIFSVYWLMFRYKVDNLLLWLAAIFACSNSFYYRMNMAKAPPLTIIFTILGIFLLFERKYIWLLPLMFVFVWTYSLFPMLIIAAFIWTVIIAWNERKFEWRPLAYTGSGMILGNVINPYFPTNLYLFWEHFITKFKVGQFAVAVGGEWYPYSGVELLTHFPIALFAVFIGYVLFSPRDGKLPERSTFFLAFVTVLLVSQFRSKRFAEYFPPFAILFAAFSMQAFRMPFTIELPEDFKEDIEPFLDKTKKTPKEKMLMRAKQLTLWLIGLFFVGWITFNFVGIDLSRWVEFKQVGLITNIRDNEPNEKYKAAMTWANENIPEGEIIYNCNWDNFPKMFFYDTKHRYAWGLDPNYLYSKNPELYKLMGDINGGKIEDPAPIIREKFNSRFIFSEAKDNVDFVANCLQSGWCETVFQDKDAIILKIRDQKGTPDEDSVDESDANADDVKQVEEEENLPNGQEEPDEEAN
ncbi:MAG: hypothetical protein KIS76_13475 [Pyrinomonadaceae bacterium]|nr:hypothetical protein [Pyrinomonadaceae bacterium]